jgi:cysteine sulfinate desulfinase/cysteine desulfurase-like protein
MHEALGTLKSGGTLRFSISPFTTDDEVDAAIHAVTEIASAATP